MVWLCLQSTISQILSQDDEFKEDKAENEIVRENAQESKLSVPG